MKIKTLLFSLGFVLLFYCCSSGDVVKPPDPEPPDTTKPILTFNDGLIPLTKGNLWKHEWTHFHGGKDTTIFEIDGEVEVNNNGKKETYFYSEDNQIKWLLLNKNDGYYNCGAIFNDDTLIISELKFKYPATPGEKWEFRVISYNIYENKFSFRDTISITCVDTAAVFSTYLGEFKTYCYHYKLDPNQNSDAGYAYDYYLYYRPHFGLMGVKQFNYAGNLKRSSKLLKYNIEGK